MNKIKFILVAVTFAIIIFFTFFGEPIYKITTPEVKIKTASVINIDDKLYALIPADALHSDENGKYVFYVITAKGFSMNVSTANKVYVNVSSDTYYDNNYVLTESVELLSLSKQFVIWCSVEINEICNVRIKF